jgi:UDP-glucose 4-epimerase
MRILVTGSEGSLMQWVIPHLLAHDHEVLGVDNFSRYGEIDRNRQYEFTAADLTDTRAVAEVCEGVDAVIQAAAQIYGVRGFHKFPADILARDVVLHQNLLWQCLEKEISRVVYISSSMVYERATRVPVVESDVEDMQVPHTDYGLSKLMGERLCRAFQKQYGLDFTIWRPFNIITPYEEAEKEQGISHVFADFIRKIVINQQNPMDILGDGEQIRCFTWIDDVARAIGEHSFTEASRNEVFNLGNPERTSMKELAQRIFEKAQLRGVIPKTEMLALNHLPIYDDDVRIRVPDIQKARQQLNWYPSVELDEALDACFDRVLG